MRIQLAKKTRQLPVEKTVQWPVVLVFGTLPQGIMTSEYARIRIIRVRWKWPIVGQIWCQIEKLFSSRNMGCALADFNGHFLSRDLHMSGKARLRRCSYRRSYGRSVDKENEHA